jgi:hypothetical protein
VLGVVAALALMAAAAGHHVDSGVKGIVTLGPTCPVEKPGDPNCRDRPYAVTLKVVRARDHSLVKRFASRADGRFRAHLATGRYLIEKAAGGALPSLSPTPVRVGRHRFTRVDLQFDSGIR